MDGNTAALNAYLAQQEAEHYQADWKENYIDDCVNAAMYQLELKELDMIDAVCEIQGNGREIFNDILFRLVFRNDKDLQENIQDYLKQELETWVDADEAYEQHVKDNEPQED